MRLWLAFMIGITAVGTGCVTPPPDAGPEGDWRQWRGPTRDGVVSETAADIERIARRLPTAPVAWSRAIGPGFSWVAVAGGRAFTLRAAGDREALVALDARTGVLSWSLSIGERFESSHGDGPRSTPTVVDAGDAGDDVVLALGSYGRLVAADAASGTERWRVELRELTGGSLPTWGFAASPLVADVGAAGRHVVVQGDAGATLVAVGLDQGTIAWTLDVGAGGYASPRLATLLGRRQILALCGEALVGVDPASGALLWRHPWPTSLALNAADPLPIGDDAVLVANAHDTGAGLVRLAAGADGVATETAWSHRRFRLHWASPILFDPPGDDASDGALVVGLDEHFLIGLHPDDGTVQWKVRGQAAGGLVRLGDLALVLGEAGDWRIGRATAAGFEVLATREAASDEPCRTPPTMAGDWLFARCGRALEAIDLGGPSEIPG